MVKATHQPLRPKMLKLRSVFEIRINFERGGRSAYRFLLSFLFFLQTIRTEFVFTLYDNDAAFNHFDLLANIYQNFYLSPITLSSRRSFSFVAKILVTFSFFWFVRVLHSSISFGMRAVYLLNV